MTKKRLASVDALRGFDMIWILGAEGIFAALFAATGMGIWQLFAEQMLHSEWHGMTAYDLIFPLFIFLSGVSLGLVPDFFSSLTNEQKQRHYRKAIRRLALLILLGVLYNHGWGTGIPMDPTQIRYASVLAKIGIAWFAAAMIVWHLSHRRQYQLFALLLLGYWALLTIPTVTVNGVTYGANFSLELSLNAYFDQQWLPGIHYRQAPVDPEGLLSNFGSVANALAGAFVGRLIRQRSAQPLAVMKGLLLVGVGSLLAGYAWGQILPINKTLWTSSFALMSIGWCTLLLAVFYWVIDVLQWQRWSQCFIWIGMNSIVMYILSSWVNWHYLGASLFGGVAVAAGNGQNLVIVMALLAPQLLLAYWLFKRQIIVKI